MLFSHIGNSQTTYNSQYIVNMPDELGERYTFQTSNKIQQSFRLNMDDKNAVKATIKYLFLNADAWEGPDKDQLKINFYDGTIDNIGTLVYTQPYAWDYPPTALGFVYPTNNTRFYPITGNLELEPGKDYVLEIEAPANYTYPTFGFKTVESDLGSCNLGDRDIWMKFYGSVSSDTDPTITINNEDPSDYQLDVYSRMFPTKLLNKYEPSNLFVNSSLSGNLQYHSSDESILKVEILQQETGVKDKIELMGLKQGSAFIYITNQNDTISHIKADITNKEVVTVSFQYFNYPGETQHSFMTAYSNITQEIVDVYDFANVYLDFTDQGVIEFEWDLDGDGDSYEPDASESYALKDAVPNASDYFSNLFMYRVNKTDSYFGGSNGGGSSFGFGELDSAPRFGWVALHLFRTEFSLAETVGHELAHNFGLSHYSDNQSLVIDVPNDLTNIMKTGRMENLFYGFQWNIIHNTINYVKTQGELPELRATAQINNFSDLNIDGNDLNFQLAATTNSESEIIYKLISGNDVVTINNDGSSQILKNGEAEVMAYTYATRNHLATSKKITLYVSYPLNIEDLENDRITIYPNPTEGMINVNLKSLKNVAIRVFDSAGRIVYQKKNINTTNQKIELKGAPGIYFIEISSLNKTKTYKLVLI